MRTHRKQNYQVLMTQCSGQEKIVNNNHAGRS
jgi:hypothetical protein